MNQQQSIRTLHEQGWSKRRIARELGLDRATVRKYLAEISNPATPQPGSGDPDPSKSPTPHTGSVMLSGPASLCDPWREEIEQALERGLSIQRIYQDLVTERQFAGSYYAVRRFVLRRVAIGSFGLPNDASTEGSAVYGFGLCGASGGIPSNDPHAACIRLCV